MKKVLVLFVLGLFLTSLSGMVRAEEVALVCKDSDHVIWENPMHFPTNRIIACLPGENWDAAMAQTRIIPTTDSNSKLIAIRRGQTVRLASGQTDTCPTWYPVGCTIEPALFASFVD